MLRKRLTARLVAIGAVVASITVVGAAPVSAATQNDCTFSAPTPKIVKGKASFSFTVNCTRKASWQRQVVWDLVGDDRPARTHTMKWGVKQIDKAGKYTINITGWNCNEDSVGNDEIFVRVRTGTRGAMAAGVGQGYKMSAWVNGKTVSGPCTK